MRRAVASPQKRTPRFHDHGAIAVAPPAAYRRLRLAGRLRLAISDPDKLEMQSHWNREHFVKVKEMGTKLVRIPVHPVAWRERTPAEYLRLLDQAVGWCTELDLYVMIDWHSIGNLVTGGFQDPMYDTTLEETNNFWRVMARHFAGHNTVAFFELFNEPTTSRNQLGPIAWGDWKRIVETQITMIRAANPQVIPVVAGFDWAYELSPSGEFAKAALHGGSK